jgi:secretory phospholipase A2
MHIPTSDGCGSLGVNIDTEYLPAPEMAKCCDAHDICYDTCNSDKELCDLDFKRCLYKYCDSFEKGPAGDVLIKGCKAAAKMLFTGTMTLGCKSYQDAQQRACFCPAAKQKSQNNYQKPDNQQKYNGKKPPKDKRNYGWKGNDEI